MEVFKNYRQLKIKYQQLVDLDIDIKEQIERKDYLARYEGGAKKEIEQLGAQVYNNKVFKLLIDEFIQTHAYLAAVKDPVNAKIHQAVINSYLLLKEEFARLNELSKGKKEKPFDKYEVL